MAHGYMVRIASRVGSLKNAGQLALGVLVCCSMVISLSFHPTAWGAPIEPETALRGSESFNSGSTVNTTPLASSPGFRVTVSPGWLILPKGAPGNATITVVGLNGYTGNVTISASVSLLFPFSFELAARRLFISPITPSSQSTLSVSWKECYCGVDGVIDIKATDGSNVTHYAMLEVTYQVFSFSICAKPYVSGGCVPRCYVVQVPPGSTGTCYVFFGSPNGYSGNVNVTATVSPSGPSVALSSSMVRIVQTATFLVPEANLTLSAKEASIGNYTVTVTATDGYSSMSDDFILRIANPVVVAAPSSPIPSLLLAGSAVGLAAALVIHLLRKRARQRDDEYWSWDSTELRDRG